jgi:pimeloyl-ACP methyl ester carboxylesterase
MLLLGSGCASVPSAEEYARTTFDLSSLPSPVVDGRAEFRQLFCAVMEDDDIVPSGDPDCASLLWKLPDEPKAAVAPARSSREPAKLRWYVVTGAVGDCFGPDALPFQNGIRKQTEEGRRIELIEVSGRSGTEHNARQIADALSASDLAESEKVALLGYSKGAVDILQFLVDYPDLATSVVAVVSASSPIYGSLLASKAEWAYEHLFANAFSSRCDPGDAQMVSSLVPETRKEWLEAHPLPDDVRYYSLGAFTTREHFSRALVPAWRILASRDARNDGQLVIGDALIPGATLLGFANTDHWGLALTIENELPRLAHRKDPRPFPQDQILEAIVRFVEARADENR